MEKKKMQGNQLKRPHNWKVPIWSKDIILQAKNPEQHKEKTVDIIISITSRQGDKNIVQLIGILSIVNTKYAYHEY